MPGPVRPQVLPTRPEVDDWQGYFVRFCFDCLQCKNDDRPWAPSGTPDKVLRDQDADPADQPSSTKDSRTKGRLAVDDQERRDKFKARAVVPLARSAWRAFSAGGPSPRRATRSSRSWSRRWRGRKGQ